MSDGFYNNAVYWVEVDRIKPNPYQPRKEFDPESLRDLAESIKQYGVLQPLTVIRQEIEREDGGISVEYELIAGERRLRAAKLIGIQQVPVLIRSASETNKMKLELAIIENLQREDISPIERAMAFQKLVDEFHLKHIEVAQKVGKSREYVSNTLRLLSLPEEMQKAMMEGKITEGHARPLLMLSDRPTDQQALFTEIQERHLAVRETERIARRIATEKTRKQHLTPDLQQLEKELSESFGTRVIIEQKKKGGQVRIDFFSEEDIEELSKLVHVLKEKRIEEDPIVLPERAVLEGEEAPTSATTPEVVVAPVAAAAATAITEPKPQELTTPAPDDLVPYSPEGAASPLHAFIEQMPAKPQSVAPEAPVQSQPSASIAAAETSPESQPQDTPTPVTPNPADDMYSVRNFSI